jgi:MoxR-like ATPase
VVPDDVKALVDPVLGHRIILRPNAEMQGASATRILHQLMEREQVPQTAYDA